MDQQNKTYSNFLSFLNEWGKQFEDLKHILLYLNTYPELLSNIELQNLHDSESIIPEQEDWFRIRAKFEHPLEKEFFKTYWVPILRDSWDYFVDLSDDNYPIFETHYFFFEPYRWYKKLLVKNINSILLAPDENIDLQLIIEQNDKNRWEQVRQFFEQRRKMAFEGKLHIEPIKPDELIVEESDDIQVSHTGNNLSVKGASPLIIGLLPFNREIELKEITMKKGEPFDNLSDVKLVRDMIFLLRNSGILRVESYTVYLIHTPNNYISFIDNHTNFCVEEGLIRTLKEKLNTIL